MNDQFQVLPEELEKASKEIADAISDIEAQKIEQVRGHVAVYGHEGVGAAMDEFCEAMGTALPMLTKKCKSTADGLQNSAQHYRDTDGRAKGHIDRAHPDSAGGQQ